MNKYIGFAALVFTAFLSALSQILLNIAARRPEREGKKKHWIYDYLNVYVISAYFILFFVLLSSVYIMKYVEFKEANAVAAITYFFAMLLSSAVLKEKITWKKAAGNLVIILGIIVFML